MERISGAQKAKRGRRIAWVAGLGVLAVVALLALEWERVYDLYYAFRTGYEFVWMPEGVVPGVGGGEQVNNSGQVAVTICENLRELEASSWTLGERRARSLGSLLGRDRNSIASAINEYGDIVGWVSQENGLSSHAFLWTVEKGMEELAHVGVVDVSPTDINKGQQVVGTVISLVFSDRAILRAFLWERGTGFQDLPPLTQNGDSSAVAINEEGWIVGNSTGPDGVQHPVLWKPDLEIVDLGFPPGYTGGFATGINERREILVNSRRLWVFSKKYQAHLWREKVGYSDMPIPSGSAEISGIALNNRGEVLLNAKRAFLFSGGTLKELPPPPRSGPATYTYTGLNDLGWLVGYVQLKGKNENGPASRLGFLARPFK